MMMNSAQTQPDHFTPETLCITLTIRPCRQDDLRTLEWYGVFKQHRELIEQTFADHLEGRAVMLVADVNGVASGQVWIDLVNESDRRTGVLWALRVMPCLQKLGIGSRLVHAAEEILRQRGLRWAELAVHKNNPGALRLYRRLGYRRVKGRRAGSGPQSAGAAGQIDHWVLRKRLRVLRPCNCGPRI